MVVIKKFRIKSFKKQKPIVSLKKISLSFGKRQILDNINFDANQGQILGLLGPNGVGKSNLLEGVELLTSLRSHRASNDQDLISWDQNRALLRATANHSEQLQ